MSTTTLTTFDLPYCFEGPRGFIDGPYLLTFHGPNWNPWPNRSAYVGQLCRSLDSSPTTAHDSFGASDDIARAAEVAEQVANMARKTGSRHTLGNYVGPRPAGLHNERGCDEPADLVSGSRVWGLLAQGLLERAVELYEQGERLLLVEAEREERATKPPADVTIAHDGRPVASRYHGRRAAG